MRNTCTKIVAAGLFVLAASPAFAQPPGGFRMMQDPNTAMLLRDDKVQTELKISDDQKADLKKVADKYGDDIRKAFMDMDFKKAQELVKSASDDADKLLKPDQVKRMNQLKLQAAGLAAFSKDEVQTALKLTDKQKKDIEETKSEIEKDAQDIFKDVQGDQDKRRDAFKKIQGMRAEALTKVMDSMTDDQKKAWKDLTGDKFEFSPPGRRPGTEEKPKDK